VAPFRILAQPRLAGFLGTRAYLDGVNQNRGGGRD
jgi:hypothetical protein